MPVRRISVAAVVAALLLPAVAGCLMPAAAQAQTMDCCAKLNCARGHEKRTCFSTTAPTSSSQSAPESRTSLSAPLLTVTDVPHMLASSSQTFGSILRADAPQHSPPDLYTLHLALLI
jgi:hypothetical protein